MDLKDKVFQNHVEVELRNGYNCIVVADTVINSDRDSVFLVSSAKADYNDNFVNQINTKYDIMKATLNGEVIYDRDKINWFNVPVNTKVLVRDSENCEWKERYFLTYVPSSSRKFYTFADGENQDSATGVTSWKYCKLIN